MNPILQRQIIKEALNEDIGFGDLSGNLFSPGHTSSGSFIVKSDGTVAGLPIIEQTYSLLSPEISVSLEKEDGDAIGAGDHLARVAGPTSALLSGERLILNFLQHLSGIATATQTAVNLLGNSDSRICDTRKTLPGMRMLQKYAARCGGGYNHRYRLDDGIMIKDNHIKAAGGSVSGAVQQAKKKHGLMVRIEVETENREQVLEAIEAGADIIMFDNRSAREVKELVELVPDHITTEVSGGITLDTLSAYRDTGVDYISLGFLTHSVKALDISFNLNS